MELKAGCVRIKIKKNCLDEIYKWVETLKERKDEVLMTLKDEGIYIESVFLDKLNGDYYLIYYLKMEDIERAKNGIKNSQHLIDVYHKAFKANCWVDRTPLELLIDIDRIDEIK